MTHGNKNVPRTPKTKHFVFAVCCRKASLRVPLGETIPSRVLLLSLHEEVKELIALPVFQGEILWPSHNVLFSFLLSFLLRVNIKGQAARHAGVGFV